MPGKLQFADWFLVVCTLVGITLTGCNGGRTADRISGTVTLDGNLLESGSIEFLPFDAKTASNAASKISQGLFSCSIKPGEYRVQIRSPKVVGTVPLYEEGGPVREMTEESIPPSFNDQSELKVTILAGKNTKDFTWYSYYSM